MAIFNTFEMHNIQHIFFDLDGTLWDFSSNSIATQKELFNYFHLNRFCSDFEAFERSYHYMNDLLWEDYRNDLISKEKLRWYRFFLTLKEFGVEDEKLAGELDEFYIRESPEKTNLIPGAREILDYLVKRYNLHILTNGFTEVQLKKLHNSHLSHYFKTVTTSEQAGVLKPRTEIFLFALRRAEALPAESLMIGDSWEVDILGAQNAGMSFLYFTKGKPCNDKDPENCISELAALRRLL